MGRFDPVKVPFWRVCFAWDGAWGALVCRLSAGVVGLCIEDDFLVEDLNDNGAVPLMRTLMYLTSMNSVLSPHPGSKSW